MKTKKKRKKELHLGSIEKITYVGELFQKGLLSWTKRYCVISDRRLICYRTDRDSKPVHVIQMFGYDVTYVEKDGKCNHVLRVSRPGFETHWFYADTKDVAQSWLTVILFILFIYLFHQHTF